jgi:hypothetical protein
MSTETLDLDLADEKLPASLTNKLVKAAQALDQDDPESTPEPVAPLMDPMHLLERGLKTLISNQMEFGDLKRIAIDQPERGGPVTMSWLSRALTANEATDTLDSLNFVQVDTREGEYVISLSTPKDVMHGGVAAEYDYTGENASIPQAYAEMHTANPAKAQHLFQLAVQTVAAKVQLEALLETGINNEIEHNIRELAKNTDVGFLRTPCPESSRANQKGYDLHLYPTSAQSMSTYVGVVVAKRDNAVIMASGHRALFTVHNLDAATAKTTEVGQAVQMSFKGTDHGRSVGWAVKRVTLAEVGDAFESQKTLAAKTSGRYALGGHLYHKAMPFPLPIAVEVEMPSREVTVRSPRKARDISPSR